MLSTLFLNTPAHGADRNAHSTNMNQSSASYVGASEQTTGATDLPEFEVSLNVSLDGDGVVTDIDLPE